MGGRTGRQHEAFASGLIQSSIGRPRETTTKPGGHGGRLDRFSCLHFFSSRTRPRRIPSQGARRFGSRSADLVVHLGRAGAGLFRFRLFRVRPPMVRPRHHAGSGGPQRGVPGRSYQRRMVGVPQVHHRLCRRGIAERRQRVRHRDAVPVLRGAEGLPASRALLGHPRRGGDARPVHRHRRPARRPVRLDSLRVRRRADRHCNQDGVLHQRGPGSRSELHRPVGAAAVSRHRPVPR